MHKEKEDRNTESPEIQGGWCVRKLIKSMILLAYITGNRNKRVAANSQ